MKPYTELKTLEDCYEATGRKMDITISSETNADLASSAQAMINIAVITEAINMEDGKKWEPNWNDGSLKYTPRLRVKATEEQPSGVGLSYGDYVSWNSNTVAPSRLLFRDRLRYIHAVKTFLPYYERAYLMMKKENQTQIKL